MNTIDLAIIGAGAAGLAAAIFAAQAEPGARILLLDGARKPGAKILVSGGGRCNVTNQAVQPTDYNGGSPRAIRHVLRAFDESRTIQWMADMGVELKLEPTGKYFPVSDSAESVLNALLAETTRLGVTLRPSARVDEVTPDADAFLLRVRGDAEPLRAKSLIFATGGLALPKSGSDGWGIEVLGAIGHRIVTTHPALVPLIYERDSALAEQLAELSGISFDARLDVRNDKGAVIASSQGSLLLTHFGVSGPVALDVSRHLLVARETGTATLTLSHPRFPRVEDADRWLVEQGKGSGRRTVLAAVVTLFPDRVARWLTEGLTTLAELTRENRHILAERIARLEIPIAGDRGYSFAETNSGGVALEEINPATMESRRVPGLFICGEVLDVDGRIGGFNFQWAWATGYLAGRAAARRAAS